MKKKKTVGQASLEARADPTKYDSLEVGHALAADVFEQLVICAEKHTPIIDEPEFCVIMLLVDDPLIKGVMRRKFYAWPYLPKPRPRQSVFLYRKATGAFIRLWSLPDAITMSIASEMSYVAPEWQKTKSWVDAFYHGWEFKDNVWINKTPTHFFKVIRGQHNITMSSESEYLNANRDKLIKSGCNLPNPDLSEPFDFSKIPTHKVVDFDEVVSNKN